MPPRVIARPLTTLDIPPVDVLPPPAPLSDVMLLFMVQELVAPVLVIKLLDIMKMSIPELDPAEELFPPAAPAVTDPPENVGAVPLKISVLALEPLAAKKIDPPAPKPPPPPLDTFVFIAFAGVEDDNPDEGTV